jgi:DNA-binding winged helix-turn-helix (wHTH) protein/type II secretory pathway predicted ATPase ExeA
MLHFEPFTLDEDTGQVWLGPLERPLRAKSFAVLRELARRRGRLVTKEELFRVCWPNTVVSQTVLRVCIREIRTLLAQDATGANTIETVGRRGYRLRSRADAGAAGSRPLLGRDRELRALRRAFADAADGRRRLVFVSGEPGIGKTTLVDHFLEEVRATSDARIASAQCIELAGGAEPYLPVLHLLGRLSADDADGSVAALLDRVAPSWLFHLETPDGDRAERLRERVPSPNRHRMLRELEDVCVRLAAERTLVLAIEDLHWSDSASVEAVAYLAQHTAPARLLMIGSFRPVEVTLDEHPLRATKQALIARRRALEIALRPLSAPDVAAYLAHRLADAPGDRALGAPIEQPTGAPIDAAVGPMIHARTDGNPLYVTATVDDLLERGILAKVRGRWCLTDPSGGVVPDTLRQLALQQLDRLALDERRVLDAASVVAGEFTCAAVAAASDLPEPAVEDVCARLAARNALLVGTGVATWPDGTTSTSYRFSHVLYREVLDGALDPAVRRTLHRRVADRLEGAWAGRADQIAPELATHADAAGDAEGSIRYHIAAATSAKARVAEREVVVHQRAALAQLGRLSPTTERSQTALGCLLELGSALVATKGAAAEEVHAVHRRALALADELGLPQARIQAQSALYIFDAMRADLHRARADAADVLATAARMGIPFFTFIGHVTLGSALFNLGDFPAARGELEAARAMWTPAFPAMPFDPTVIGRSMLGFTALVQGESETGAAHVLDAVEHAETIRSPYNVSYARELAAQFFATAGDRARALEHATAAAALAGEHGFVVHAAVATLVTGWATGDVALTRAGIDDYEAAGQYLATSFFRALLVEALLEHGDAAMALAELDRICAFVERSGERRHEPELYRLRAECLRRVEGDRSDAARNALAHARELARRQGARLWEARAAAAGH